MLLSMLKRRREEKAAELLADAKDALQRQGELIEEMRVAVAAYHAVVFRLAIASKRMTQGGDLGDMLAALEYTAGDQEALSRVYNDLTLSHCGNVRSVLLQRRELERDLPPVLKAPDSDQIKVPASQRRKVPLSKHHIRMIGWVNDAAQRATQGMRWLNGQYSKESWA